MAGLDWQGWLTIGVVLATLALLLWERFSPDKVLLGATVALAGSGILGVRQALAGFWNPGVLTVAVLFVLVAALKSTGAIRWIDWIERIPVYQTKDYVQRVLENAVVYEALHPEKAPGGRPRSLSQFLR